MIKNENTHGDVPPKPKWACDRCRSSFDYSIVAVRAALTYEGKVLTDTDDFSVGRLCIPCAASLGRWWSSTEGEAAS